MNKLSEFDKVMLQKAEQKKKRQCSRCPNHCSKACGNMVYAKISSSGGRWVKIPDERCTEGL